MRLYAVSGGVAALAMALGLSEHAAAANAIHAEPMFGEKVRIDGDLREWPSKMTELGDVVQGKPASGDPSASVVVGYDETTLYVVLKVKDGRIARTSAAGTLSGCPNRTAISRAIPMCPRQSARLLVTSRSIALSSSAACVASRFKPAIVSRWVSISSGISSRK